MNLIKVEMIDYDKLDYAFMGLRVCTNTLEKITKENYDKNIKLLKHALEDEVPHLSVLKHINYKILIKDVPRSLLQEYARHTVGNYINVLSTRWALHKAFVNESLNSSAPFEEKENTVRKYYCFCGGVEELDKKDDIYIKWVEERYNELITMKELRQKGFGNDKLKFLVNENLRTTIFATISALAMRNLLNQRLYKDAWYVFRYVAKLIWDAIPEEHRVIYEDIVKARL